jgi:hypothetical protein
MLQFTYFACDLITHEITPSTNILYDGFYFINGNILYIVYRRHYNNYIAANANVLQYHNNSLPLNIPTTLLRIRYGRM